MSRPRKKDSDKQTHQLPAVRCTTEEYVDISERSRKAGLSLSAYVRRAARGQKIIVKQSKWDSALIFQLRKLAVNLNQQTRKLHETGRESSELKILWKKIALLMDEIISTDQ